MRRRKTKDRMMLLVILLLGIGLGYAFLQTDLTINGTSKINATSWDIHFDHVKVKTGSVELSTEDSLPIINPTTLTDITYTVTLKEPGEFYEFMVDVVNDGTLDAMVGEITSKMNGSVIDSENPLPEYLSYAVTYDDNVEILPNHLLVAGSVETLKVKVLFRTDIDPEDLPAEGDTITFSYGLTYVQADSNAFEVPLPSTTIRAVEKHSYEGLLNFEDSSDVGDFRSFTYRKKIKTITLSEEINPPEDIVESWDISADQRGGGMAYLTINSDDNTMYDLFIQGDGSLYANPDSSFLFYDLRGVDVINNIEALNVSNVVSMSHMFMHTGSESALFTLDLGNNFDTSKVTNMNSMFAYAGYYSPVFTLDLGDKFNTAKVTYMKTLFAYAGYSSPVFTLDLGNEFDTSKVTNMEQMFQRTGYSSTIFTLNLGSKFDTSNVTNMQYMFMHTG